MARKITSDNPLERQKAYAQRVDHQYFERAHPWRTWKSRLSWGLPLLGFLMFCVLALRPGGEMVFMPGPVSRQHAPFGQRCEECHERKDGNWGAVLDAKCIACHAAPVHSIHTVHTSGHIQRQMVGEKEIKVNTPGCVSCHSEHHGQSRLSLVENSRCTQCHDDLKRSDGAAPSITGSIRDFSVSHVDWRVLREGSPDDTPYRLNHKMHCDPDQVTWPKEIAEQAKRNPSILCAQCHQPDSSRAYFKPINYAAHCSSCHGMEKFSPAIEPVGKLAITHGDPQRVAAEVTSQVATYLAKRGGNPALLNAEPVKPADDDEEPAKKKAAPADTRTAEQWVHQTVQSALQPLFFPSKVEKEGKSCLKCHIDTKMDERGILQISPKKIPDVWLKKARFDHHAHETLSCISCHKTAPHSQFTTDVIMPDISSCRVCHSPNAGARTDCVECHRYHDRDLTVFNARRGVEALSATGGKSKHAHIRTAEEDEALKREHFDAEALRLEGLNSKRATWDSAMQKELAKRAEEQRAREKALAPPALPDKTVKPVEPVKTVEPPVVPEPVKSITLKPIPVGKMTCPNCKKEWPGDAKFCGRCGIKILKGE